MSSRSAPADRSRAESLKNQIGKLPRLNLGNLPTSLDRLPALSRDLGIDLWIKRDDQTGFALGGNKVRKLEFLLADAVAAGCDTVITTGGSQSNHARLTAAGCRVLGLECHLVLDRGRHPSNGNLLLDRLFDAKITFVEDPDPGVAAERMLKLKDELTQAGRQTYLIPRGGSVPTGATGYANMVLELEQQLQDLNLEVDYLYLATGSCGTHSGVMAGHAAMSSTWKVQGVSVSRPASVQAEKVSELASETLRHLELDAKVLRTDINVNDQFVGQGYGVPTQAGIDAIKEVAAKEAILLDPVYSAKSMSALLSNTRTGVIPKGSTVVFLHTGGSPALFAYADELVGI